MKVKEKAPYKICAVCLLLVLLEAISGKLGTYPVSIGGVFYNGYIIGIVLPAMILLLLPINNKYRKVFWKTEVIVMMCSVIIISTALEVITFSNKIYYDSMWQEQHWTWSNSPPIRWDFWNIL